MSSKIDLANHVRVYTGRLFYDGSYTDEQRWVKAEFFEALRSRGACETSVAPRDDIAKRLTALADLYEREGIAPGVIELAREAATALRGETTAECPHGADADESCPECLGAPSDDPDDNLRPVVDVPHIMAAIERAEECTCPDLGYYSGCPVHGPQVKAEGKQS